MAPEDLHLSDVHLRAEEGPSDGDTPPGVTVFAYGLGGAAEVAEDADGDDSGVDSDGDVCVRRKRRRRTHAAGRVSIRHALETPLGGVGLQVWRGALVLADHLLSSAMADTMRDATVLDLGAGCGLTSIVAALAGARAVFCTDAHCPSLANAQHNAEANGVSRALRVRRLDWSGGDRPHHREALLAAVRGEARAARRVADADGADCTDGGDDSDAAAPRSLDGAPAFGWAADDGALLSRCGVVLAADCVYDDRATSALVRTLAALLPLLRPQAVCLLALERRINFCLEGMAPRAPAAEHLEAELGAQPHLQTARIPVGSVAQRFEYERESRLELLRVTCRRGGAARR